MREIGVVKHIQIQQASLKRGEKPDRVYDPVPLLRVDRLMLSPQGVVGVTSDGTEIIDVHNAHHPDPKNGGVNGISVGFTTHYAAMRVRFGAHLTDGIAGENVLIEAASVMKLSDLGKRLVFQNASTGALVFLDNLMVADPCEPFSRFALRQPPPVAAPAMKATLQFLGERMRGFYAAALSGTIYAGDKVFASDDE